MSVEQSRKHGHFDARYPSPGQLPAPSSIWLRDGERVGWEAFVGRFFAGRRRHDFEVLAAYESYRNALEA